MGKKKTAKPTADISMKVWLAATICIFLGLFESGITLFNDTFMGNLDIVTDVILTILWCFVCEKLFKRGVMSKGLGIMIILSCIFFAIFDIMIFDEFLADYGEVFGLLGLILYLISRIVMMCKYSGWMKKYAIFDLILSLAIGIMEIYMENNGYEFGYAYGDGRIFTYAAVVMIIIPYNYMYNMLIEGNEDATFIQII